MENERARLAEARKSPQQLEQYDLSLLEALERRLKDFELGRPEAKAKWLKEQERIADDWTPAFDSSDDVGMQALDRLYEAERALSKRDFLLFSVGVEKVIHLGFNEFLLSEGEGARLTNMPRSRVRRGLKALSAEGVWIRRRPNPRSEQNKKSWAKEQGKGWGKLASVYYIPLHG